MGKLKRKVLSTVVVTAALSLGTGATVEAQSAPDGIRWNKVDVCHDGSRTQPRLHEGCYGGIYVYPGACRILSAWFCR